MKVAVTSEGQKMNSVIDPRFGRAKYFFLVDTETGEHEVVDNEQNLNAAQGAGIQTGQNVVELRADAVISGNVGPKAFRVLEAAGVKVFLSPPGMSVSEAVECLKAGDLDQINQANVEGHWV
ncbi:NifB/NifX family molybdenum-iron cluster-binding protein [Planctomycetota bacterium]